MLEEIDSLPLKDYDKFTSDKRNIKKPLLDTEIE